MLDYILKKEVIAPAIIIVVSIILYYIITRIINRLYKISRHNDKKRNTLRGITNNIIKYFLIIVDLTMA